jgi:hypothetical protein
MRETWFGGLILERRFSMAHFRLDVSQETGAATLWMATEETACGFKPVLAWPSMEGVKEFAHMLLEIDRRRKEEICRTYSQVQAS